MPIQKFNRAWRDCLSTMIFRLQQFVVADLLRPVRDMLKPCQHGMVACGTQSMDQMLRIIHGKTAMRETEHPVFVRGLAA